MTDISKCNNDDCELKGSCWRYLAPSSEWQSYGAFPVYEGHCEYYLEVEEDE